MEDYQAVRELVVEIMGEAAQVGVREEIRETIPAVKNLSEAGAKEASITAVGKVLKLDKSSASRRCRAAIEDGYLVNLEDTKGKPARLVLGADLPARRDLLPAPEVLQRCEPLQEGAQHPTPRDPNRNDDRRTIVAGSEGDENNAGLGTKSTHGNEFTDDFLWDSVAGEGAVTRPARTLAEPRALGARLVDLHGPDLLLDSDDVVEPGADPGTELLRSETYGEVRLAYAAAVVDGLATEEGGRRGGPQADPVRPRTSSRLRSKPEGAIQAVLAMARVWPGARVLR